MVPWTLVRRSGGLPRSYTLYNQRRVLIKHWTQENLSPGGVSGKARKQIDDEGGEERTPSVVEGVSLAVGRGKGPVVGAGLLGDEGAGINREAYRRLLEIIIPESQSPVLTPLVSSSGVLRRPPLTEVRRLPSRHEGQGPVQTLAGRAAVTVHSCVELCGPTRPTRGFLPQPQTSVTTGLVLKVPSHDGDDGGCLSGRGLLDGRPGPSRPVTRADRRGRTRCPKRQVPQFSLGE